MKRKATNLQDQIGLESDYEQKRLPESKISVDAFLLVYDIDHSIDPKQTEILINLMTGAQKTKRPIILVVTKCDSRSYPDGMRDLQQFLHRKELRNLNYTLVGVY